ncbi:MAG: N-acetylmuramoyl-L-alanine amidase, partial [Cyclobacteriaceae bacterium]|nr:N-acetylmuramoyl-L-alanine amidase [Cyclobacteriaceae bacterium]MDX5467753.1 N-acetylmuramoyl-L-alanine amidase [Cyclobacteriaceae bacterium]
MKCLFPKILLGGLALTLFSCSPEATFRIIDKPITWNAEREQLSLQYLKDRHGLEQNTASIKPQMVVV